MIAFGTELISLIGSAPKAFIEKTRGGYSVSMEDFVETIALSRLPIGRGMVVRVAGNDVALFNVDGDIYAMSDACAHAGASLGSGKLQGKIVTCRAHGFRYDVTTGHSTSIQGLRVATYPVKIVDGKIMVAIAAQNSAHKRTAE